MSQSSLALLEIGNLVPALVVADRCCKAAEVEIVGIENTMGAEQCIKLAAAAGEVREAGEQGVALARRMGSKADLVELVGKEKIGAAYVTIMVRGNVSAVQAAVAAGKQTVEKLEGKLVLADVITHPHPELAALLPA